MTSRAKPKQRPTIRLLFDEHVSPRVARALGELRFRVAYVGGPDQPPKGTEDAAVLTHARGSKQTIVTTNHDMIVLCAEQGESVIWLTPRDKDISLEALAGMCFSQVRTWERMLSDADGPICIMAHKTTCTRVPMARAKRIALERGRRRRRRESPRARQRLPGESTFTSASSDLQH